MTTCATDPTEAPECEVQMLYTTIVEPTGGPEPTLVTSDGQCASYAGDCSTTTLPEATTTTELPETTTTAETAPPPVYETLPVTGTETTIGVVGALLLAAGALCVAVQKRLAR